jgi:hypothetical protein
MELLLALSTLSTGKIAGLVLMAFIVGLVAGAQITSHEERALDYNLEDVELDEMKKLEAGASAEAKAVIAKLKAAAARAKTLEQKIIQGIRSRV